ncbi:Alpha-ketoglutarate-dependent sulfonate dioxygenase [Mycena kentingensis (nom. inval.)]|nr:Alpha-ketoglutarate-dependent sulfonate dioxygenase [Mycena kentingensis (nom. inval.)]
MAPVATTESTAPVDRIAALKAQNNVAADPASQVFNPFYSPSIGDDGDDTYIHAQFKPHFPKTSWPPLAEIAVSDRGLLADPEKKSLFSAASKVRHLTPAIGTEILGIDLRQFTEAQKDELALLVAERGVVFFRDQEIDIHGQLDIARHFGPLHKHATTPIPRNGMEEVHVVYNDSSRRPDPASFSKLELWHSDVSYEIQPPSTTSLKVITGPEYGGDTLWSSGYALYSSFSPGFQKYLEGLSALHSAVAQADGSRAAGLHVRREPIETIHPLVRVHPATGWKSIYANPGFTRRIIGLPKAESDAILSLLFHQLAENPDFQVRFKWEPNSIAFWDNRVRLPHNPKLYSTLTKSTLEQIVTHSATFDFYPHTRHALRATPHGEKPISVAEYEKTTGKTAKDRQVEIWRAQGIDIDSERNVGAGVAPKVARYND